MSEGTQFPPGAIGTSSRRTEGGGNQLTPPGTTASMASAKSMTHKASASADIPIESIAWMWGDASLFSHSLAKKNPFRWSTSDTPETAIESLREAAIKDKYNANRPVVVTVKRGYETSEERFANMKDAIVHLRGLGRGSAMGSFPTTPAGDAANATLILPDGREHTIKIILPGEGEDKFLDIRDLHAKTGYFTYDPGFTCTGACMSAITFIDGPEGICLYRGYEVGECVKRSTALEVAYLLLKGNLPSQSELSEWTRKVFDYMLIHKKIEQMFDLFTINAHPMAIMVTVIGGLSTVFSEHDGANPQHRELACVRMVAKVPVLAAFAYKTSRGEPVIYPRKDLGFAENWLHMMFASPMEKYTVNPLHARAIDAFMILHMDHEQNASTSTVRTAGSSQANPYACVAAGIASLWGAAHGGANEAVINMLEQIGTVENVAQFVDDVKNKKHGVRLMGFGHRVYKNYDPRAKVMKGLVDEILGELGVSDPLLAIAKELEEVAVTDEYFVARKLYPNVDYYSGILLRAIGIPTSMFTVMFAMSRTVGWMAQWDEMISEKQMRITRPRQVYVGEPKRDFPDATTPARPPSTRAQRGFTLDEVITR